MSIGRALSVVIVLCASLSGAFAGERLDVGPKSSVIASVGEPGEYHEVNVLVPRGAHLKVRAAKFGRSGYRPLFGLFDEGYQSLPLVVFVAKISRTSALARTRDRRPETGLVRVPVSSAKNRTGDFKASVTVVPQRKVKVSARADDEDPATTALFGALPGYELTAKTTWKGTGPVTVRRVGGPDDTTLESTAEPTLKKRSWKRGGYVTTATGDHVVELDVPEGTERWTLTLSIKGKLEADETLDIRPGPTDPPPQLTLGGSNALDPLVTIAGEDGAGNEALITARVGDPSVIFLSPVGECNLVPIEGIDPTVGFDLVCDRVTAQFRDITRDVDERVVALDILNIESATGNGQTLFSNRTFHEDGTASGWTEIRTFEGTGNTHTLVLSGVRRYPNGIFTFTVHHTEPGGATRRYDLIPF